MRTSTKLASTLFGLAGGALATAALAAPVSYQIDPAHTYPTFEADHNGGMSYWRGKINGNSGKITLDKEAGTGTVEVTMDMKTLDFGHEGLNAHAQTSDIFDTGKFPTAVYSGKLMNFKNGAPTTVEGTLTMHGVTKPVTLTVNSFLCKPGRDGKESCGADASTKIDREDFGVSFGKSFGFKMDVTLRISVEAAAT